MTARYLSVVMCLAGCDLLSPRVPDPLTPDAAPAPDTPPPPPDGPPPFVHVLPAGSVVPTTDTNPELLIQIRINDGLSDAALTASGGVVTRGTGKAGGNVVRFWNFGPSPVESGIAVVAPVYIFGRLDAANVFTPILEHPQLIDSLPGDTRYSPMRRVVNVPVTDLYDNELITSIDALGEAIERGLVLDPINEGTWMNMPVVLPGTKLEVATDTTVPAKQVYADGYVVDVFELGTSVGRQPFRSGFLPIGQASGLQTGVPTGTPPALPTTIDAQLVFQFAPPPLVTPTVFSYSPLATDVTVRLADTIAPSTIFSDADLFKRSGTGAITAFIVANVASFTIGTTVTNIQVQYTEGSP
jgi:hypothetical protein